MPDLIWIPCSGVSTLPSGYYWLRDKYGKEYVIHLDPDLLEYWMHEHITDYCPIPAPREPRRFDRSQQLSLPVDGPPIDQEAQEGI